MQSNKRSEGKPKLRHLKLLTLHLPTDQVHINCKPTQALKEIFFSCRFSNKCLQSMLTFIDSHYLAQYTMKHSGKSSETPQHRPVSLKCTYNGEWKRLKFFVTISEGSIIQGLLSFRNLTPVTMLHYAIQETKCTQINFTKGLMEVYPDQLNQIGNFAGEYYIVLKSNSHPINYATRIYPIQR